MNPTVQPRSRRYLSIVKDGEEVVVKNVEGGRNINRRLRELGIGIGSRIRVVQNTGGPVIIEVDDSRMGLGRGVASKIIVE